MTDRNERRPGSAEKTVRDIRRATRRKFSAEEKIRPIALGRKNALFAGSDEGGANWAIIASLTETCKLNYVNPHAWLADTLTKLVNHWPQSRIDELMPWAYDDAVKMGAE